jgi:DnaJ-class molecular chaperone
MNTEPRVCPTCRNQFEGRMPGWVYGSNWEWVPCQTCNGTGRVSDEH